VFHFALLAVTLARASGAVVGVRPFRGGHFDERRRGVLVILDNSRVAPRSANDGHVLGTADEWITSVPVTTLALGLAAIDRHVALAVQVPAAVSSQDANRSSHKVPDIRDLMTAESLENILCVSHIRGGAQRVARVVARGHGEDSEGHHFWLLFVSPAPRPWPQDPFLPPHAMY